MTTSISSEAKICDIERWKSELQSKLFVIRTKKRKGENMKNLKSQNLKKRLLYLKVVKRKAAKNLLKSSQTIPNYDA